MRCPACGSGSAKYLGNLGRRAHLRCTDCGYDYSAALPAEPEPECGFCGEPLTDEYSSLYAECEEVERDRG